MIRLAEEVGPTGYAYGIDISDGMVAKARKNLEKFSIGNAEIIQSSLDSLPFADKYSGPRHIELRHQSRGRQGTKYGRKYTASLKRADDFVVSDIYSLETGARRVSSRSGRSRRMLGGKRYERRVSFAASFRRLREYVTILSESTPVREGQNKGIKLDDTGSANPVLLFSLTYLAKRRL